MPATFRKEFDAKLSATEARMDGRVTRIEEYTREITKNISEMRAEMREDRKEILDKISGFKVTVITTAIASVLAIVLGVASFNAALTSNILTAFQAGLQGASQKGAGEAPPRGQ